MMDKASIEVKNKDLVIAMFVSFVPPINIFVGLSTILVGVLDLIFSGSLAAFGERKVGDILDDIKVWFNQPCITYSVDKH